MLSTLASFLVLAAPKVAVMNVEASGIDPVHVPVLTEVLTTEINNIGGYDVISGRDINAMLGYEATRQSLGCDEMACLAEIGGALGTEYLVVTQVGQLGDTYVVNVKLIDIKTMATRGRASQKVSGSLDAVLQGLRDGVSIAFTGRDYAHRHIGPLGLGRPSAATGTLLGASVLSVGVASYFGLQARTHHANAVQADFVGAQREIELGESRQRVANIGFAAAALTGLVGAVLWLAFDSDLGWTPSTSVGDELTPQAAMQWNGVGR